MDIGKRLQIEGPQFVTGRQEESFTRIWPWTVWRGHASDEYGNCSVYIRVACLGGIVLFWEPPSHFQRDIELPELGASPWIDRRYHGGY